MQLFVVTALLVLGLAASEISGDAASSVPVSGNGCAAASAQAVTDCGDKVGCPMVRCDGDDYAPTQCIGNGCWCVQKDNTRIGDLGHDLAHVGLCGCVRAWADHLVTHLPEGTEEEYEDILKRACFEG